MDSRSRLESRIRFLTRETSRSRLLSHRCRPVTATALICLADDCVEQRGLLSLVCPPQQRCADCKSRADRCKQYQTSLLEFALLARCFHGERDGSSSGVSKELDVNDHGLGAHAQALGRRGDDALVCLMWNKCVDLAALDVVAF